MWKIAIGVFMVMACTQAQALQDLLLPQARHVVGVVFDPEGNPIVEALVAYSNDPAHRHQTDSAGKFELDTRAPAVVIRKAGFRSALIRTRDASEVRVTLQRLRGDQLLPTCSNTGKYYGLDGWGSLQFPRIAGVKASRLGRDIDYGSRTYYVNTKQGLKEITHGAGILWTFGMPSDQDVWESVRYEEIAFDVGGVTIMDARGQMPNGSWYRILGQVGEIASYSDTDESTAKTLDRLLDGACLKPTTRQ